MHRQTTLERQNGGRSSVVKEVSDKVYGTAPISCPLGGEDQVDFLAIFAEYDLVDTAPFRLLPNQQQQQNGSDHGYYSLEKHSVKGGVGARVAYVNHLKPTNDWSAKKSNETHRKDYTNRGYVYRDQELPEILSSKLIGCDNKSPDCVQHLVRVTTSQRQLSVVNKPTGLATFSTNQSELQNGIRDNKSSVISPTHMMASVSSELDKAPQPFKDDPLKVDSVDKDFHLPANLRDRDKAVLKYYYRSGSLDNQISEDCPRPLKDNIDSLEQKQQVVERKRKSRRQRSMEVKTSGSVRDRRRVGDLYRSSSDEDIERERCRQYTPRPIVAKPRRVRMIERDKETSFGNESKSGSSREASLDATSIAKDCEENRVTLRNGDSEKVGDSVLSESKSTIASCLLNELGGKLGDLIDPRETSKDMSLEGIVIAADKGNSSSLTADANTFTGSQTGLDRLLEDTSIRNVQSLKTENDHSATPCSKTNVPQSSPHLAPNSGFGESTTTFAYLNALCRDDLVTNSAKNFQIPAPAIIKSFLPIIPEDSIQRSVLGKDHFTLVEDEVVTKMKDFVKDACATSNEVHTTLQEEYSEKEMTYQPNLSIASTTCTNYELQRSSSLLDALHRKYYPCQYYSGNGNTVGGSDDIFMPVEHSHSLTLARESLQCGQKASSNWKWSADDVINSGDVAPTRRSGVKTSKSMFTGIIVPSKSPLRESEEHYHETFSDEKMAKRVDFDRSQVDEFVVGKRPLIRSRIKTVPSYYPFRASDTSATSRREAGRARTQSSPGCTKDEAFSSLFNSAGGFDTGHVIENSSAIRGSDGFRVKGYGGHSVPTSPIDSQKTASTKPSSSAKSLRRVARDTWKSAKQSWKGARNFLRRLSSSSSCGAKNTHASGEQFVIGNRTAVESARVPGCEEYDSSKHAINDSLDMSASCSMSHEQLDASLSDANEAWPSSANQSWFRTFPANRTKRKTKQFDAGKMQADYYDAEMDKRRTDDFRTDKTDICISDQLVHFNAENSSPYSRRIPSNSISIADNGISLEDVDNFSNSFDIGYIPNSQRHVTASCVQVRTDTFNPTEELDRILERLRLDIRGLERRLANPRFKPKSKECINQEQQRLTTFSESIERRTVNSKMAASTNFNEGINLGVNNNFRNSNYNEILINLINSEAKTLSVDSGNQSGGASPQDGSSDATSIDQPVSY